ncbi:hypothetical protein AKH00_13525 [Microbacterium sp. GCS4]|nr:hypothetical protein AKH00_13525 [Microbacterium sp. GCS4]
MAGIVTVTLVWLMFSSGSTEGRRLGFFDSLFVSVDQREDGTTGLEVGLANPAPLVIAFVVVTFLLLATLAVYDMLVERRAQLLAEAE